MKVLGECLLIILLVLELVRGYFLAIFLFNLDGENWQ